MAFLIWSGFFCLLKFKTFSLDLGQLKYWQIYQLVMYIEEEWLHV